ncbi:MAG: M23 family metallopeptidase [Pseudomonadales bacterium]|jgi:murein DD-endopeptidase MepM/ murein hydrolase activator NlpD|nr:M23 family metallopeptidase [Pseudomonadales bacterium]
MQLLLINKNGEPVQISLPSWKIRLVIVAVVALCSGLIASGFMLRQSSIVDAAVIENWRMKIQEQDAVVEELQTDSVARRQAVGRQIADMQARLWRMEALASYMHESSGLPQDEFDFDAQVSQGGPINPEAEVLNVQNLDSKLANLSERLKQRETELSILDQVLMGVYTQKGAMPAGAPIVKGWMSSPFGERVDPISGKKAWHEGMDFAGANGSDVVAVANGIVVFSGRRDGYGLMVEISHGENLRTRYGHHQELLVRAGQSVKRGDVIGLMGSSGRSTGPHVHFEVLKSGKPVNPARYVSAR